MLSFQSLGVIAVVVLLALVLLTRWALVLRRRLATAKSRLTEELRRRRRLERDLSLSHLAFLSTHSRVMVTDKQNRIVLVNPAFTEITGYSEEEAVGQPAGFFASGRHDEGFYRQMWSSLDKTDKWEGEVVNRHKAGHIYTERLFIVAKRNSKQQVDFYVGIFTDVSQQVQLFRELKYSATHDSLTGLPNRQSLHDRIDLACAQARRSQNMVAIAFLDLDRFKPVNDTHGHSAGDELLQILAERMTKALREGDTVARVGGDEFVVVLNDIKSVSDALKCAEALFLVINEPFTLKGVDEEVSVSTSIGLRVCTPEILQARPSADQLVKQADSLMYLAKEAGRGRVAIHSGLCDCDEAEHSEAIVWCTDPTFYVPPATLLAGPDLGGR